MVSQRTNFITWNDYYFLSSECQKALRVGKKIHRVGVERARERQEGKQGQWNILPWDD